MKKTIAQQLNVKEFPFVIKDKKDNLIYYEYSNGDWYKYERDEKGNLIYYESSNGDWSRYEYDKQGNLIYRENSIGYWERYEYDEKGNELYYENSYGTIIDNRIKEMTKEEVEKEFKIKIL
jgi:YD repeat-containing protein